MDAFFLFTFHGDHLGGQLCLHDPYLSGEVQQGPASGLSTLMKDKGHAELETHCLWDTALQETERGSDLLPVRSQFWESSSPDVCALFV